MIKVALKHFIYEKCIDVIFDGIINNFSVSKKRFNVDDRFTEIKVRLTNWSNDRYTVLYDCTILDNIQGTVLIEHHSHMEANRDEIHIYTDFGPDAPHWRVNIDDIKFYI